MATPAATIVTTAMLVGGRVVANGSLPPSPSITSDAKGDENFAQKWKS